MVQTIGPLADLNLRAPARRRLAADEVLFVTGDPVARMFVVETGSLRMVRHDPDGTATTLYVAGPGTLFAEASLFSGHYHCDAVAEGTTDLLIHSKADILAALTQDPAAALSLLAHFAQQIQGLRARIDLITIKSAPARVLGYLHGQAGQGAMDVRLHQTWKAVASEIGLTPEAVYRALATLERDGAIKREGRRVHLHPTSS